MCLRNKMYTTVTSKFDIIATVIILFPDHYILCLLKKILWRNHTSRKILFFFLFNLPLNVYVLTIRFTYSRIYTHYIRKVTSQTRTELFKWEGGNNCFGKIWKIWLFMIKTKWISWRNTIKETDLGFAL